MPIRPVDLQVMMPKTSEIAQMNQNAQNRLDAANQQLGNAVDKKTLATTKEVVKTNESRKGKINKDDDSSKKNNYRRNNKNKKKPKDEDCKENNVEGTTIDLRI